MLVNFVITGRLGNAIFRYMASVIVCLYFNGTYVINNFQKNQLHDASFIKFMNLLKNNKNITINHVLNVNNKIDGLNMIDYYQHDEIYKFHKNHIIEFIKSNPSHYILTDGIEAGDMRCEKFFMIDIINTPQSFNKYYKNVLHVRLEDFVKHNLYLKSDRIINLLEKNIITDEICIVCKKPSTAFEINYIKIINDYLILKNIKVHFEHNDVLTDYYIMKEANTLICSMSTLSWCAAFFSNKIQKCYLPDYETKVNSTCKKPINNTELY